LSKGEKKKGSSSRRKRTVVEDQLGVLEQEVREGMVVVCSKVYAEARDGWVVLGTLSISTIFVVAGDEVAG